MPRTVMLVDDSSTVRMQATHALSAAGFRILEAKDGVEALDKLEALTDDIALIVCDVNMPRMSGIELLEALAARGGARPPILMLTTEGHPHLIQRAKEHGAKGWMVKPFRPELLVAAVCKIAGTGS
ncbi:MAG: response regulator [Labilithrix sp.]|nr:response regulator [Labilithrix sp.]